MTLLTCSYDGYVRRRAGSSFSWLSRESNDWRSCNIQSTVQYNNLQVCNVKVQPEMLSLIFKYIKIDFKFFKCLLLLTRIITKALSLSENSRYFYVIAIYTIISSLAKPLNSKLFHILFLFQTVDYLSRLNRKPWLFFHIVDLLPDLRQLQPDTFQVLHLFQKQTIIRSSLGLRWPDD